MTMSARKNRAAFTAGDDLSLERTAVITLLHERVDNGRRAAGNHLVVALESVGIGDRPDVLRRLVVFRADALGAWFRDLGRPTGHVRRCLTRPC